MPDSRGSASRSGLAATVAVVLGNETQVFSKEWDWTSRVAWVADNIKILIHCPVVKWYHTALWRQGSRFESSPGSHDLPIENDGLSLLPGQRSEEHTSELQAEFHFVC